MSILHRRRRVRLNQEPAAAAGFAVEGIPAWRDLQQLDESEATALARQYGIEADSRMAAIRALNQLRKGEA